MKKPLTISFWRIVALIILTGGAYALYVRFFHGLGAATALSDEFPWGLWIGFDVLVGVGLAAGGFTVAAIVHIFNLEKYEPISRPSLLTAFLGYILVGAAIFLDIGQPQRIWHPLVMWNPHSVMFEVAWCVTLYTTVLALEFSPLMFEKFNLKVPLKLIRTIYLPLVIVGVLLSTLHQSSLGTVYVIVPEKLHHLWYSPMLPIFFYLSAIAAGLAMTIFESFLSFRAFGKRLELDILTGLGRVIVVTLAVYLMLRFQDLLNRGNLPLAFELTPQTVLFWGEIGLGCVLPMILLFIPKVREQTTGLFFAALLVIMGFILNRLNVSITGMLHAETYIPKWTEMVVTASMVTAGFIAFALAVKYFDVFPREEMQGDTADSGYHPDFSGPVIVGLWTLILIGFIAYGLAIKNTQAVGLDTPAVLTRAIQPRQAPEFDTLPADRTFGQGENSPGPVIFSHTAHMDYQEKPSCQPCHTHLYSYGQSLAAKKAPGGEAMHEVKSCGYCHNEQTAFGIDDNCETCHSAE